MFEHFIRWESSTIEYCCKWALSDPKNPSFASGCTIPHENNCHYFSGLTELVQKINGAINTAKEKVKESAKEK